MVLFTWCGRCRDEIKLKKTFTDRGEMRRAYGEHLTLICPHCAAKNSYHVNRIRAQERKTILLPACLVAALGTGSVVYLLKDYLLRPNNPYNILAVAGVLLIPMAIFIALRRQEREKVHLFNTYYI